MNALLDAITHAYGGARAGDAVRFGWQGWQITASPCARDGAEHGLALHVAAATMSGVEMLADPRRLRAIEALGALGFGVEAVSDGVRATTWRPDVDVDAVRGALAHLVTLPPGEAAPPVDPAAARALRDKRDKARVAIGVALAAFVGAVMFTGIVNALCRPLVSGALHPIAIGVGLAATIAAFASAYRRRSEAERVSVVVVAAAAAFTLCTFLDGLAVLVNQVAAGGRDATHDVTLVAAVHKRIKIGRHGAAFDATTNLVVDDHGAQIGLGDFEHLRGTVPVGAKLRLTLHAGALGFAWIVRLEPGVGAKPGASPAHRDGDG